MRHRALFLLPLTLALSVAQAASSISPNRGTTPVVYDTGKGTHLPIMTCGSVAPDGTVTSTSCGDASASGQSAGNASLASIDSKTPSLVSGRQPVDGLGVTQPVSAASLPLPTGAATSALQTSGNATLTSISGQLPATLGQKASAASQAVVLASDQSAINLQATPTASAANGITPARCQNCSSLVAKASAGNLYWLQAVSAVSQGYVMVVDAAAAPSSPSAVSPLYCMSLSVGGSLSDPGGEIPAAGASGLVILFSSTGCSTYTALSATQLGAKAK